MNYVDFVTNLKHPFIFEDSTSLEAGGAGGFHRVSRSINCVESTLKDTLTAAAS